MSIMCAVFLYSLQHTLYSTHKSMCTSVLSHCAELTVERGRAGKEGGMLEDDLPCENMLTVNTIAV